MHVQGLMLDLSREDQLACPEVQGQILSINANCHPILPALPLLTASQLAAEPFPLSLVGQSTGAIPSGDISHRNQRPGQALPWPHPEPHGVQPLWVTALSKLFRHSTPPPFPSV